MYVFVTLPSHQTRMGSKCVRTEWMQQQRFAVCNLMDGTGWGRVQKIKPSQNVRVAISSCNQTELNEMDVQRTELPYFDLIGTCYDVVKHKPAVRVHTDWVCLQAYLVQTHYVLSASLFRPKTFKPKLSTPFYAVQNVCSSLCRSHTVLTTSTPSAVRSDNDGHDGCLGLGLHNSGRRTGMRTLWFSYSLQNAIVNTFRARQGRDEVMVRTR